MSITENTITTQTQLNTDILAATFQGSTNNAIVQGIDPTGTATIVVETITAPDTATESNPDNAVAQVLIENAAPGHQQSPDTLNADNYAALTTLILGDPSGTMNETITGTNAAHALTIDIENVTTVVDNNVAADTINVYGVLSAVDMSNAAGAIVNMPANAGNDLENLVNMGGGANQVVNDAGTNNTINTGSGANQKVNESGSGATIGSGNSILLQTGANTLVTNSGNMNTIHEGSGTGQSIQNTGDGVVMVGGSGANQSISDVGGLSNSITAGVGANQVITETGSDNTIVDAMGAAGLQITAASGNNHLNVGEANSETVVIGGGNNVVDIRVGTSTSTASISGAQASDTIEFEVAQSAVHLAAQIVGAQELVTATFVSGPSAGQSVTILGTPATLTFTDGSVSVASLLGTGPQPSAANSSIGASPGTAPADGATPIDLTVIVKDASGNIIPNETVSLTSTDAGDHFAQASGQTNAAGQFTTTLTSTTVSPTDTITATEGTASETTNVGFTTPTGPLTPTTINITEPSLTAVADSVQPISLTLSVLDQNNAPMANQTVTIAQSGHGTLSNATLTTNALGVATETITDGTSEINTITAQAGAAVAGVHANFTPALPDVGSTLTATSGTVLADGVATTTLTTTVLDSAGVPIANTAVNLTSSDSGDVFGATSGLTNAQGQFTTTLASTTPGTDTITATEPSNSHTETTQVLFTAPGAPAPDASASSVTISPTSVVADGTTAGTVTVTVEDVNHHVLAGQAVTLSSADAGDTLGANAGVTNAAGQFTTTISSITPGADVVTAVETSNNATETGNVTFTAPLVPTTITVTGPSTIIGDNVDSAALVATVDDQNGIALANTVVNITEVIGNGTLSTTQATTNAAGQITENVTDATPNDTNVLEFQAGSASAEAIVNSTQPTPGATSTLVVAPSSVQADGLTPATVTVTLLDAKGVPIAGDAVNLEGLGAGDAFAQTSGTTNASGVFTTTVTSTTPEIDTITAQESTGQQQTGNVTFTAPPAPSAANSSLLSSDSALAADGTQATALTLTVNDEFGNPMANQQVTLSSTGTGDHLSATTVTTDANGHAVVNLSSTTAGTDTVTATETSNGAQETASVLFTQEPSAAHSTIVATPTPTVADGVTPVNLTITVKDTSGNPIANQTVTLSSTDAGDHFGASTVTTNASGVATTTLTSTTPSAADTITATEKYTPFTPTTGTPPAQVAVNETANVVFTAQSVATAINLTGALNSVADNVAAVTLAGVLLDQFGSAMANQTVHVTESGHGTLSSSTLTTDASGRFTETITDGTAETNNVTFTSGGAHATAATLFAAPVATTIVATATPSSVAADGHTQSTIVATVDDQAGNAMGAGSIVTVSATGAAALGTLSGVTNSHGQFTDTVVDHSVQTSTITLHDGSATGSTSVTFTSTTPPDSDVDMTAAALTTLAEAQGISAATIGSFLTLIAPQANDNLYPVENVTDPSMLVVPDVSFTDAGGHTDQPSILDVLIANGVINTSNFPNLGAILDDGAGHMLVTGSHSVDIAGNDTNLLLGDTGADTVVLGNTNLDKVTAGAGHDTITTGLGTGDIVLEGSGSGQSATANGATAALTFGSGNGQQMTVNGANSVIQGGTGAGDTAVANGTHDTINAGTGIAESLKGVAGTTFHDATSGIALINGLAGGETYSLGHGELTSVQAAGGNNTLGFASGAGGVINVSGLLGTDQVNFQASASAVHATAIGNEELITITGSPGELIALSFANAAAAHAAMVAAHYGVSV